MTGTVPVGDVMVIAFAAAAIGGIAAWFLGRAGEATLADQWRSGMLDALDRAAAINAAVTATKTVTAAIRAELQDISERLNAWDDLTRTSDGVYGWHDGQTATWAELGLTDHQDRDDTGDTQGGNG